jgi:hypothetical protein
MNPISDLTVLGEHLDLWINQEAFRPVSRPPSTSSAMAASASKRPTSRALAAASRGFSLGPHQVGLAAPPQPDGYC